MSSRFLGNRMVSVTSSSMLGKEKVAGTVAERVTTCRQTH